MQITDPNRRLSEAQITLQGLNAALLRYNQLLAQNSGTSAYRVDNKMLEDARRGLAQLVVDYNLAAMQLNRPIIDYSSCLGQADFLLLQSNITQQTAPPSRRKRRGRLPNARICADGKRCAGVCLTRTLRRQALAANMDGRLAMLQLRRLGRMRGRCMRGWLMVVRPAADAMRQVTAWIGRLPNAMREANAAAAGLGACWANLLRNRHRWRSG